MFYGLTFCVWLSMGLKIPGGCVGGFCVLSNGENMRCRALGSGMRAIITNRCLPGTGLRVDVGYLETQQARIYSISPCLSPES